VLGAYWALVLHRTNLVKPPGLPVPA
jgi:hypothetical protein